MNLIVEIGNTALKAAWVDGTTLGKTFRYQGEHRTEYIRNIVDREKPEVIVVSSVYDISSSDESELSALCRKLIILDPSHPSVKEKYGFPQYLSYDRVASLLAARNLFKPRFK